MLTQDFLKEHFSYDIETGLFIRLKLTNRNSRAKIGDVAGCKYSDGYIYMKINSKHYKAHRLAFLYVYGEMPKHEVDHINGVKDDNRISNLRDVTKTENVQNQRKAQSHNKLGVLGVHIDKESSRFIAKISINGKQKNLGRYDTKEEAHDVYLKAKRENHLTCTI